MSYTQVKLQWLQKPSEISEENLNNVRHVKPADISGIKRGNI
jgi:hypothetical protein